jgi:malate dehydrogenase
MSRLVIAGAGELAGALARSVAARDRFRDIVIWDDRETVAAGKALDIQQSGPVDGFRTQLRGTGHLSDATGADVVVIADSFGPPAREWQGEPGLSVVERLGALNPHAVFVCAGASQTWLVQHAARESSLSPSAIVGSALEAFGSAVRALVALEVGGSALDVHLEVLGVPPNQFLVRWSTARAGDRSLEALLGQAGLTRMNARLSRLWPPGPYALAAAATRVAEAVITSARRRFTLLMAVSDPESGERVVRGGSARVDRAGVSEPIDVELTGPERVALGLLR